MQCQLSKGSCFFFQFGKDFISVLNKKTEINTLQDTTKKKQMPTKDIFWPVSSFLLAKLFIVHAISIKCVQIINTIFNFFVYCSGNWF